MGQSATRIRPFRDNESGHPIRHQFTRSIPSSQCMVCHMHPGTNMVATYFGYTWWDNEMDGEAHVARAATQSRSAEEQHRIKARNPEGSAVRGLWSDVNFLEKTGTPEFNQKLEHTQFADFHSHGWIFRAVFKHDRKGKLLDSEDKPVSFNDADKFKKAVHLKDIHLEKGMHCIDCHFEQDSHGNGKLYGETRNAVEIDCVDCHGTMQQKSTLITSGIAAPEHGTNLAALRTPWKERRFYWKEDHLYQRSMLERAYGMGGRAGCRYDHARQPTLQREVAAGEDHPAGRSNLGRSSHRSVGTGAREQPYDVLRVSLLLGAHLLRMPSCR